MWLGDCNSFFLLLLFVFVLSILPENVNTRVETGMRMYDLLRPYRDTCTVNVAFPVFILCMYIPYLSGTWGRCQHGAFSGVGAIVARFVLTGCPVGRGMWGIFGKPLNRAIWNSLCLHTVLTTCLRSLSVSDGACVACCVFLSTGRYHVCIQIHANVLLLRPMHHKSLWYAKEHALGV